MNKLTDKEILSILGFEDDPKHSLLWYVSQYHDDLVGLIHQSINNALNQSKIYPKDAEHLSETLRCHKYHSILIKESNNRFMLLRNNSDRGLVESKQYFNNVSDAINELLNISYCAGGALKDFINKR